jgi:hypothetical protein
MWLTETLTQIFTVGTVQNDVLYSSLQQVATYKMKEILVYVKDKNVGLCKCAAHAMPFYIEDDTYH